MNLTGHERRFPQDDGGADWRSFLMTRPGSGGSGSAAERISFYGIVSKAFFLPYIRLAENRMN